MRQAMLKSTFFGVAILAALLAFPVASQSIESTSKNSLQQFVPLAFSDNYALGEAEGAWIMTIGFARSCIGPHCPVLTEAKLRAAHATYADDLLKRAESYRSEIMPLYQSRLSDRDIVELTELLNDPVYKRFEGAKAEIADELFWGASPAKLPEEHYSESDRDAAAEVVNSGFPKASPEGVSSIAPYYETHFSEDELHRLLQILKNPEYEKFIAARDAVLVEKPFNLQIIESLKLALPLLTGETGETKQ